MKGQLGSPDPTAQRKMNFNFLKNLVPKRYIGKGDISEEKLKCLKKLFKKLTETRAALDKERKARLNVMKKLKKIKLGKDGGNSENENLVADYTQQYIKKDSIGRVVTHGRNFFSAPIPKPKTQSQVQSRGSYLGNQTKLGSKQTSQPPSEIGMGDTGIASPNVVSVASVLSKNRKVKNIRDHWRQVVKLLPDGLEDGPRKG